LIGTILGVLFIGVIFYAVFGLGSAIGNTKGTVSVTDVAGRTVQVPAQVDKVVGTGCSDREIVYLNASDKLVGVEQVETNLTGGWGNELPYIIAHPELMSLPVVGNAKTNTVNYEEIAKLNPDVVFASDATQADTIQNKTGIPTVVVYTGSVGTSEQMDEYEKSLQVMGKVLGKEDRANELINYMNSTEKDLANRTANVSSNTTVYLAGQAYYGSQGITSTNPYYPPFMMLNAVNVASNANSTTNSTLHAIQIDKEQLITWNPDYMFVEGSSLTSVENNTNNSADYSDISAIKNGNVYGVLSYCLYSYNKDEMFADAYYIGKVLYPEQFSDVDPEEKANEIFVEFDGQSAGSVYSTLKSDYGGFKKVSI
jgi:iron complex transport system substrate-binding protein